VIGSGLLSRNSAGKFILLPKMSDILGSDGPGVIHLFTEW
jgi:hypothetical protein